MKDINTIMPKIQGMRWGAVTNISPTMRNLQILNKTLRHDQRWHTVLDTPKSTIIDDIPIVKKTKDSMT